MQKVNQLYDFFRKAPSSKIRLVFLYRTVSLILTSFFFLLGPLSPLFFKVGIVISLCVAAWITSDLQKKYISNNKVLKLIVLTETIGLTLLLIPTGGISSPFIWYALNPVLVAASFLRPLYCWAILTFYLGSATLIAYHIFEVENMVMILGNKSYFYVVCILTIVLARLFSGLNKELDSKAVVLLEQHEELLLVNNKLIETNDKYEETLEHIMSLYHLMDNYSSKKSPKKLAKAITTSLLKFTQSDATFVWLTDLFHENSYIATSNNNTNLQFELKKEWNAIRGNRESFTRVFNNEIFLMKIIRTSKNVGVLGVRVSSSNVDSMPFLLKRTFEFITELSEIMLERIYLDQMIDQTLVIEEQNRIANEIHDSVSQRLFGIVYSLHGLQVKSRSLTKEQLNDEYQFLSQSANKTIKELRSAIYRLSSIKKGEKPFLFRLKTYLDEYAKLNDILIHYKITGDESLITNDLKHGLYRIISEACGNSVRHGECQVINLKLSFVDEETILVIQDDGLGINMVAEKDENVNGIGLINMQSIVHSFNGIFSIEGIQPVGTKINIKVPNTVQIKQEVVG